MWWRVDLSSVHVLMCISWPLRALRFTVRQPRDELMSPPLASAPASAVSCGRGDFTAVTSSHSLVAAMTIVVTVTAPNYILLPSLSFLPLELHNSPAYRWNCT